MARKYLYKCNPKVAEAAGLTPFDRYTWPDGTFLLWEADMVAIDRVRFKLDCDNFLADLGAVKMTDPEAAAEQQNPTIRLPEARMPEYRWEQPDFSKESGTKSQEPDAFGGETKGGESEELSEGAEASDPRPEVAELHIPDSGAHSENAAVHAGASGGGKETAVPSEEGGEG